MISLRDRKILVKPLSVRWDKLQTITSEAFSALTKDFKVTLQEICMDQNKNRGLWLAGTVCSALAAVACLIAEYGYEKIILPRGYQWMYPWMQTAVLAGAVVFTVLAVLCQLSASGKKKIAAIGGVIIACIAVVVCSGLSGAGQVQVLRSPAGNYQVILEKDEETGQLMLNRPYKGLFRYQKELLPFTADSKVNSRWLEEDACALYGTDTDGNPAAYLATYGSRSMNDTAYVDPLSAMSGIWEGTDADGQTWTLSVGGQDAVKDAWIRLSGKTATSWYGEPECERYGTIGMILEDGTQADYFVVLNKDCVWGDSGLIGSGSMTICKADLEEEPIILSRQRDVDSGGDWSDAGSAEDFGEATWAENPDDSFDAAFGVDAEDVDAGTGSQSTGEENQNAGTGSQSNDEESWDEGADAGWLHSESEAEAFVEGTKIRYQMIVEDAALGSRFYGLIKSTDGGAHWQVVSSDPFGGQMGGSVEFTFLEEEFGFATLSHNGGDAAVLYVTEDGGKHYEQVEFAHKTYTDSIGNIIAPYDYPKMPYEKDGVIYVLCGQGADGDYDGGDSLHLARYRSEDHGHSFVFDTLVDSD